MRALLSVWDKTGLVDFAVALRAAGVDLVASGGTSEALRQGGVEHLDVEEVTNFPEMLDGRVKTLHPNIHAAILADLDKPTHRAALEEHEITAFDLVVSNLYPFSTNPSIELIDVGGPTMVRAAAKNYHHVAVVTSPSQYPLVLAEIENHGRVSEETRFDLARAAFAHTASYDAQIAQWFESGSTDEVTSKNVVPTTLRVTLERAEATKYGENPHQVAARYRLSGRESWWDGVTKHAGSALSYLNFFDADAAWRLVHELDHDAPDHEVVAIIKHANASGAAVAATLGAAFELALAADPMSAFGGVIALGGYVDNDVAVLIAAGPQADVIIAAGFSDEAVATLVARRKATRVLSAPSPEPLGLSIRTFGNMALVQNADEVLVPSGEWRCVTNATPSDQQLQDLVVAWRVCARTTSNAIVIARDGVAVGIAAGQQSRVVASDIAVQKAGERARGGAAASDAFFPFADGLESLTNAGVTAVVQPGGSVRDQDVIDAANQAGIVMMLTGERHFRH
jgi:phosphoribosylaminoimidazolecarboxamide formyltransferase / IMP cyclohydrolase